MGFLSQKNIVLILAVVALLSYPFLFLIRGYDFSLMTIYSYIEYSWMVFLINLLLLQAHIWKSTFLAKRYPWVEEVKGRFFWELFSTMIFTFAIVTSGMFTLYFVIWEFEIPWPNIIEYNMFALFFSLFLGFVINAEDIITRWKSSILEKEKLEKDTIKANLKAIQANISPHFLFNNLNVLHALIDENTEQAQEYLDKLSLVYRFILRKKDEELIGLQDELAFIKDYLFLLSIRFGDQVTYQIDTPSVNGALIPPATLQILVENAIKHNEVSLEHPLCIHLKQEEDGYLCVSNNMRAKNSITHGEGFGLQNIKERYGYLSEKPVIVEMVDNRFTVKIPLLEH